MKERGQILQEMQAGLRTRDEARERLEEMDKFQVALMKRLGCTRQQLSSLDSDDGLLTFSEDGSSDGLI